MPHPAAILLTLTPSEQREFLPKPLLDAVRSLTTLFEHLDPTNLTPAEFQRALTERNPEILIACWGTPPLPAKLPSNLRYVSYLAGSIKHLLTREHITNGLLVTNWGHSISRTVAEMALLHILAGLRRTTHWTLVMHQANGWKNNESEAGSLFGRRVGIHGFGPVARELLKLLQPFGCTVAVHAPDVDATTATRYGISATNTLADLFADNEIIVELAPLIPATTGIVTEKILRLIRPGGIFVNVGRGAVVDEAALLRVATEGKIAIGLDVFSQEPLPADSGFRRLSNVALTPHMAGPTNDRKCDAGAFALSNLRAYAADHPLQAVITPSIYDASS
jgi:phosphoglycerate dehydrogenase-like enzyme